MHDLEMLTGWIALLLGEADALRAKGITSIGVAGCTATFAPVAPAPSHGGEIERPDSTVAPEGLDALYDPHSYPAGIVPGYDLEGARRERERSLPLEIEE